MSSRQSRRQLGTLVWSAGLLSMLVACRDAEPAPAVVPDFDTGPLVTASADLRTIDNSAPAWGDASRWTVGDTPTLELADSMTPFAGLAPVLRLSDGRIVVAVGSQQSIRIYDKSGKVLSTLGGPVADEGPFHGLGWVGRGAADTILAYDFVARRFALYDRTGKFARFAKLQQGEGEAFAEPIASYPDGSVLFRIGGPRTPFVAAPGTVVRDSAAYVRYGTDGVPAAMLGAFPQGETFGVQVRPGAAPSPFPVPYGLWTSAALRGDDLLIGTGASFEIAAIGPDGTPLSLLRAPIERAAVTPEAAREYTASAVARLQRGAASMQTELDTTFLQAIERAPFPSRKPAFGRLVVDRTGALWVSEPFTPPAEPSRWTVFSPEGQWLGSVTTPAGFRIDEIGKDYVLGVWRQEDGAERVRMYPLSRGSGT